MNTCKECCFSEYHSDGRTMTCYGLPPSVIQQDAVHSSDSTPGEPIIASIVKSFRPEVGADDHACSLYSS